MYLNTLKKMLLLDSNYVIPDTISDYSICKETVDGVLINYATIGNGRPIICIHGWTNNWTGWIPLSQELKDSYKLYLLDLPGFGESGTLYNYTIKNQARIIARFITKLRLEDPVIVGLSMGSYIAAQFVHDFPKLADKAILIGAVYKVGKFKYAHIIIEKILNAIQHHKKIVYIYKQIVATRLITYIFSKYVNMYKFNRSIVDTYGMRGRSLETPEALVGMGISIAPIYIEKLLDNAKIPILFIHGEADKISTSEEAQRMMKGKIGNFTYTAIPRAGHVASVEQPKLVAEKILKFI